VYAIGAPQGLELTLSEGLISGLRKLEEDLPRHKVRNVIQTTAAISPGSSGGGLFDARGQLVGITTFLLTAGQSLNFAIPTYYISTEAGCQDLYRNTILAGAAEKLPRMTIGQAEEAVLSPTFDESEEVFKATQATQLWQFLPLAHYCLGHALLLKELKTGTEVWKDDSAPLADDRQFQQAIGELKEATRLEPEYAEAHDWLAVGLWRTGDLEGCVRELREVIRLGGGDGWQHHRLAGCLREIGDKKGALTEYRRAYELMPDSALKSDYERALREVRDRDRREKAPKHPD